ncbi:MAG: RICIN domain-containing protein [Polyangiaceae bacterium]
MKPLHFLTTAAALVAMSQSFGCVEPVDSDPDGLEENEDVAEIEQPLVNGTTTTGFAPVVRISWTGGGWIHYCTATAIADDLLVTAAHCVKTDDTLASYIKVEVAHGANASAVGRTSSYLIMSQDIHDNVSITGNGNGYGYRDYAFIKFGAGTFSESYATTYASGDTAGWTVTKVGFGGDTTKEYATKTIVSSSTENGGDYRVSKTSRSGAYTEGGDSGGPMLKMNATTGQYEVLGVVANSGSINDNHPTFTSAMESLILSQLRTHLPKRCSEMYQHTSYGGFSWSFCNTGSINLQLDSFSDPFIAESRWDSGNWNDEMSSLELGTGAVALTLYEHSSQGGSSVTFQNYFSFGNGSQVPSLVNEGFNDKVSSFYMMSGGTGSGISFHLEITKHGKCIDTSGTHTAGTNVYQWDCQGGNDNQLFRIESSGTNYVIKHKASGLCLGAEGGGTSNGTKIELQTCDGSSKQLFTMASNASTSSVRDFTIKNVNSSKCIDLDAGSSSNGTSLQLWSCSSTNTNQNFALKKLK